MARGFGSIAALLLLSIGGRARRSRVGRIAAIVEGIGIGLAVVGALVAFLGSGGS